VLDAGLLPDEQAGTAEQELLQAERHAALREAFLDLPSYGQRLIALLIADPPVPYAEISARLGIPVGSIGQTRSRYLDRPRRSPAIAALINADNSGQQIATRRLPSTGEAQRRIQRSLHRALRSLPPDGVRSMPKKRIPSPNQRVADIASELRRTQKQSP
jgi:hypothetical protein